MLKITLTCTLLNFVDIMIVLLHIVSRVLNILAILTNIIILYMGTYKLHTFVWVYIGAYLEALAHL